MTPEEVNKLIDAKLREYAKLPTTKYGDTPNDAKQLTPKGYVDTEISSVYGAIPISSSTSANFIPKGIGELKGDIIVFTAPSVPGILPVTNDGDILVVSSGASLGVKWTPVASIGASGSDLDIQFNSGGFLTGDNGSFQWDKGNGTYKDFFRGMDNGKVNSDETMFVSGNDGGGVTSHFGYLNNVNLRAVAGSVAGGIIVEGGMTTMFTELQTTTSSVLSIPFDVFGALTQNPSVGLIEANIVATQTGGSSGTVGNSAAYIRRVAYKWNGVVLASITAIENVYTAEDDSNWNATLVTNNNFPLVQVTGATNQIINWGIKMNKTGI